MSKPRMISTIREDTTGTPPFTFQGVTTRVFPIKAHFNQLSLFCTNYLNLQPDVAIFRPALPMVFVGVINYGKMEPEAFSAGWVAQNEVFFGIPLEWYKVENGRLLFHEWAVVCPFIFVDSDSSLLTGREVYGWPKVKAWLDPRVHTWARHPRSRQTHLTLSTQVFPKIYAGRRQLPRVLLEIEQEPLISPLSIPQADNPLLSSLKDLQGLTFTFADMLAEYAGGFVSLPREMHSLAKSPLEDLGQRLRRLVAMVAPGATLHTVNMKQMRDSEHPELACYQSVNSTRMKVINLHGGGVLGDAHLLLGDLSGGYRLRIHEYDAQPIVESLGLECVERREEEAAPVSIFKPILPFWVDVDLEYGLGESLFERAKGAEATQERAKGAEATPERAKGAAATPERAKGPQGWTTGAEPPPERRYKTTRGGATEALIAPFSFPDSTVFVFPMLADTDKLKQYCGDLDAQMQKLDGVADAGRGKTLRIEPFSYVPHLGTAEFSYVYMTVTNFGEMSAPKNDIGWWAEREVAFFVPVRVFLGEDLVAQGMLLPFVFMDNGLAMISSREVNGWPTAFASIKAPEDLLMSPEGPTMDRQLLQLQTEVAPALHMRQRFEHKLLLEILEGDVSLAQRDEDRNELNQWSDRLLADFSAKSIAWRRYNASPDDGVGQSLFVPPSLFASGHLPFNVFGFKQMKDLDDVGRACFQAFTSTPRRIQRVHEVREIDRQVHVRLHRYPTHPIVERLGLFVKTTEVGENPRAGRTWSGATVENIEPIRPFLMRVAWEADVPRDLLWRSQSETWYGAGRLLEESKKKKEEDSLFQRFVERAMEDRYLPLSQVLIETALWDYEQRGKDSVWHQYWSWDFNLDSLSGISLSERRLYEDFPPFWVHRRSLSKKSLADFFKRLPEELLGEQRIDSRNLYQRDLTGLPSLLVKHATKALPATIRGIIDSLLGEMREKGSIPEHVSQLIHTIRSSEDEARVWKYFLHDVDVAEMRVFLEDFMIHFYARMNELSDEESLGVDDTADGTLDEMVSEIAAEIEKS